MIMAENSSHREGKKMKINVPQGLSILKIKVLEKGVNMKVILHMVKLNSSPIHCL